MHLPVESYTSQSHGIPASSAGAVSTKATVFLRSQRGSHQHFSQAKRQFEATLVILPPGLCSAVIAISGSSFVRPLISTFVGSCSHSSCFPAAPPQPVLTLLPPTAAQPISALCPGCHHSWLLSKSPQGKELRPPNKKEGNWTPRWNQSAKCASARPRNQAACWRTSMGGDKWKVLEIWIYPLLIWNMTSIKWAYCIIVHASTWEEYVLKEFWWRRD